MLVRVQNAAGTEAELALLDWLRTWREPGNPHGIAVVNCSMFHADRLHHFDAVVFTPTSCVVIEAELFAVPQDGVLEIPLNGPWMVSGEIAQFTGTEKSTPLERSREHTFALQDYLAARGLGQRAVHGLGLIVPMPEAQIDVHQEWTDPSFDVIVTDDPHRLEMYFEMLSKKDHNRWTANDIAIVFRGMGILPYLPGPQDLLDEGFFGPIDVTLWHGGPSQAQAEAYAEDLARREREAQSSGLVAPWYSPWKLYPRVGGDLHFGRAFLRITLALGMIVAMAWVLWILVSVVLTYGPA
ncbi:NERD domain-containing protein [Nocardia sp. NPDC058176]|uniref:NERD domain-containing protein n=1 Tax=Nocardia sp. NPDC058176 TaxID=3346368 RepID=UPI0036DC2F5A